MIALCCGTPMFGDFTRGFWISIYCGRFTDAAPPSMRVMTADAPAGAVFPDDGVPRFRGRPGKLGQQAAKHPRPVPNRPGLRVMTADARPVALFPDDGVPRNPRGRPGKFLVKLLTTWAAMGFRNPRLAGVSD